MNSTVDSGKTILGMVMVIISFPMKATTKESGSMIKCMEKAHITLRIQLDFKRFMDSGTMTNSFIPLSDINPPP